ncbi:fused DSP-PTPase phosphatase/NAD kinase-like protein [Clostridium tetani]|uniref:fused DSP-PTPase phosphatase/NAD kinase-like protein n=1 Tax=Clostridium tetani TaxID=1513 RepID=UPI00100BE2C6|nr:phytase [Clostridium tetani]RXM57153.1 phytase [Clostridium tetani]RXM78433.1 phytase [Clostridium tetani]RYU99967.1 phytase [Clostridium tetani]
MNRKFKIYISSFLIFLSIFLSLSMESTLAYTSDTTNLNLVLDTSKYTDMPKRFRKTSNLENIKNNNINLNGLDKLNISGSQQFSAYNLPLIIKSIETSLPITVVDLREESHGFINGMPVSWVSEKNNANMGLTRDEIISKEINLLNSIKLNVPITFYNHKNITIIPTKVENEDTLVTSNSLSYLRVPVTDTKLPTDDMVNYFVDSIKSTPKDTWFHFHCKQGIGRTSTFMIMYDMIKNSKEVSFDDIVRRQLLLAGFNEDKIKSFSNNKRIAFLKNFYRYCKENSDNFDVKWSDWKKTIAIKNTIKF